MYNNEAQQNEWEVFLQIHVSWYYSEKTFRNDTPLQYEYTTLNILG